MIASGRPQSPLIQPVWASLKTSNIPANSPPDPPATTLLMEAGGRIADPISQRNAPVMNLSSLGRRLSLKRP